MVIPVLKVLLVHREQQVHKAPLVQMALKAQPVHKELLDQTAHKVPLVRMVHKVYPVIPV